MQHTYFFLDGISILSQLKSIFLHRFFPVAPVVSRSSLQNDFRLQQRIPASVPNLGPILEISSMVVSGVASPTI